MHYPNCNRKRVDHYVQHVVICVYVLLMCCVTTLLCEDLTVLSSNYARKQKTNNTNTSIATKLSLLADTWYRNMPEDTEEKVEWSQAQFHQEILKLDKDAIELWLFEIQLGTRSCHEETGVFLFDHGLGLFSKYVNAENTASSDRMNQINPDVNVGGKIVQYRDFASRYAQNPGHHAILGHVFTQIVKTLNEADRRSAMLIDFPNVNLLLAKVLGNYVVNTAGTRTTRHICSYLSVAIYL
jgi:hypothetical protein